MSRAAELTVGKHSTPSGSAAQPLVADALAPRTADAPRQEAAPGREGAVGWPGPPPGDSRVGWPAKDSAEVGTA